ICPQRADVRKKEMCIFVYEDLLHLFPNRYIDRTRYYKINQLQPAFNTEVQIVGKIIHIKVVEQKKGKRLVATFVDDTGQMELVWFQGYKWIKENLKINEPNVVFGKVNQVGGVYSMHHP